MPEYTIQDIPTDIYSTSLAVFNGEYPRGLGNRISVQKENKEKVYTVVNVSAEDLEDAIRLGIVGETMTAAVWDNDSAGNTGVAFVIDARLDPKVRSARHWYAVSPKLRLKIEEYSDN